MAEWTGESILGFCSFLGIRALLTGAELDVFTLLARRPMALSEAVATLGASEHGLRILLDALTSLELLEKRDGVYVCPPSISRYLSSEGEETVLPMVRHYIGIWDRCSRLTAIVRPSAEANAGLSEDEALGAFIEAMHVRARVSAELNVAAMKIAGSTNLIDIGGASGSYTIAILKQNPGMRATLFDRPAVVEMARARLAEEGLLDRVHLVGGDFTVDDLPGDHDLALISAIIHQNSHKENVELFQKAHAALVSGGRVVIRDHVMSSDHTAPLSGALFAINMLTGTPGGDTYTFEEIKKALEDAGFHGVGLLRGDAEMESLVEAYR